MTQQSSVVDTYVTSFNVVSAIYDFGFLTVFLGLISTIRVIVGRRRKANAAHIADRG